MDLIHFIYLVLCLFSLILGVFLGFFLKGRLSQDMSETFSDLSFKALSRSTDELLKLAHAQFSASQEKSQLDLSSKKTMIDETLNHLKQQIETRLHETTKTIKDFELDRISSYSSLVESIKQTNQKTAELALTAQDLKDILANSRRRGQWGEKIADDILNFAGLIENINYSKQSSLKNESGILRPDFTFLLPKGYSLNMDVKFPLENYSRLIESESELEKKTLKKAFLRDVQARIKEISSKSYIDPDHDTVDCVILFIPNENIFSFIQSEDPSLMDEALKQKVICCSPLTLLGVLAVIRKAVDHFALERSSQEILKQMDIFSKQWDKFFERFENLGKKISDTQKEYETLVTTRRRMLEKPLQKLSELKAHDPSSGGESAAVFRKPGAIVQKENRPN